MNGKLPTIMKRLIKSHFGYITNKLIELDEIVVTRVQVSYYLRHSCCLGYMTTNIDVFYK